MTCRGIPGITCYPCEGGAWACIVVFLLSFFLRDGRRSRISTLAMCIGAVGILALGVEYCLDRYFLGAWQPSWSLAVLVICIGLIIPLRIVRRVPSLREEARSRASAAQDPGTTVRRAAQRK